MNRDFDKEFQFLTANGLVRNNKKWELLASLDEKYLQGGVVLSEWTSSLVRDADIAFCSGAYLSSILSAQAAMECHLRFEYSSFHSGSKLGFYNLIEQSPIPSDLRDALHRIRSFRNEWVHVNDPHQDSALLQRPDYHEEELERFAVFVVEQLRRVIYLEQCI